ncbi:hypothetical protein Nepgr_029307 [Nepenthes gracilis]|uniref:Uncharacterized protein n=1 Tax=Nepenthes gracilis TaxID=150966 RepID=A0AAD3Y4X9_NEPGR|nr:hypothetical protein Nepgr_029307 [Nepenthes gracilis]
MSQPYTRHQLLENMRRLRKKHRLMSSRIALVVRPEYLSPHDRKLLDLCEPLWHPSDASPSQFASFGGGLVAVIVMLTSLRTTIRIILV